MTLQTLDDNAQRILRLQHVVGAVTVYVAHSVAHKDTPLGLLSTVAGVDTDGVATGDVADLRECLLESWGPREHHGIRAARDSDGLTFKRVAQVGITIHQRAEDAFKVGPSTW